MRVAFAADALQDKASFRHLTAIWWLFQDERHLWVVQDLNLILNSAWRSSEGSELAREIKRTVVGAARKVHQAEVVVRRAGSAAAWDGKAWQLGADLAERWLRHPLRVLVENARVDGGFLRLVVLRVGERALRRRLGDAGFERLREDWASPLGDGVRISVLHGGGDTTADQLKLLAEASVPLPPRALVLLDSDRKAKDGGVGETAQKVEDAARGLPDFGCGWKLEPVVLKKHEVENYLPHAAIFKVRSSKVIEDPDFGDIKALYAKEKGRQLALDVFNRASEHLDELALRERCGDDGHELDVLVHKMLEQM